jgi:hypothetical protein
VFGAPIAALRGRRGRRRLHGAYMTARRWARRPFGIAPGRLLAGVRRAASDTSGRGSILAGPKRRSSHDT